MRSFAVELACGTYTLCPEQLDPHLGEGRKRSLLPVSKSTVCFNRQTVALTVMYREHRTSERDGWCADGDGTIPQLSVAVSQGDVASVVPVPTIDTPRKGVRHASIPLVCDKPSVDFPVSDQ